MKKTINWALVGTGGISNKFVVGLKAAEGANIAAVVSRSPENAKKFADLYGVKKACTFEDMLGDSAIDVIYIGTPHTSHKDLAVKAFKAGKAVLCEKPVCINAGELREMIRAAGENKVFFMEAMWTRYVPPVVKVREWLSQGLIGEVKMMQANFGFRLPVNPETVKGRLLNRELGGGAVLDAGVYPVAMASMVFGGKKPLKIVSAMQIGETGVDEECAAILSYGGPRIAYTSAAIRTEMANDTWIYGSQGKIHIPAFVFAHSADLILDGRNPYHFEGDFYSNGYNYEAEEAMDCIREGKLESSVITLEESLVIMEIMDEIRAQGNLKYPGEK
jgi:predicted dehydrogenase